MAPPRLTVSLGGPCLFMHIRTLFRTRFAAQLTLGIAMSATLVLAACGTASTSTSAAEKPLLAKDTNGTAITIPQNAPQHIVTLVATDSEIVAALGAGSRVVAVDYYTDYPADVAAKQKITDASGTANIEAIVALKPDLVLGYGGEQRAAEKKLMDAHIQVVDLPQMDLSGSLMEMRLVGQIVHAESQAGTLVTSLQKRIDAVKKKAAGAQPVSVYMEADYSTPGKPFVFGGGSFGDELIRDAGGTNIFGSDNSNGGFPQVSDETVIAANPQVIILTEDPNFGGQPQLVYQRHGWSTVPALQNKRVYAVTPDLVQRAGPRLVDGLEQLAKLLHPELFS